MLTGESLPVEKVIGSKVAAGTMNQRGSFMYQATRIGRDTKHHHCESKYLTVLNDPLPP
jgi:cation transport ATPase